MSRITEFIAYLDSHLGDMYVWGAQGQCVSNMSDPVKWITSMEKKKGDSYVRRAIAFFRQTTKRPLYAFDCSGIIMFYFQNTKGWAKSDANANGLYGQCKNKGKLNPSTLNVGDLLFIHKGLKKVHVGVYIGSGKTIEAYGRDKGVVMLPLSEGEWTHQGTHPYLIVEDNPTKYDVAFATCTGGTVNVRSGPGTDNPIVGRARKDDFLLALPEVDGWRNVALMQDGKLITGYMSGKYIKDV